MVRGVVVLFAVLVGCSREDPTALDRAALRGALSADEALGRALKEADDAAHEGHTTQADDIFKRKVDPAADVALETARGVQPRTAWGRSKKDALVVLEQDRKNEVSPFASALRGEDLGAKLAAYEKQLELERRAQTLAQEIGVGP